VASPSVASASSVSEQSSLLSKLTHLQQRNRDLERSLTATQNQLYAKSSEKDNVKVEQKATLEKNDLYDRGSWLLGLLILQSGSSFILANYEKLLSEHQALIYFLTMLVGAGGNAGNQACVKMVRELAIGTFSSYILTD
jgi:Mg/Co/Ni transporter MgtE